MGRSSWDSRRERRRVRSMERVEGVVDVDVVVGEVMREMGVGVGEGSGEAVFVAIFGVVV